MDESISRQAAIEAVQNRKFMLSKEKDHDYAHCTDFADDCPQECFRAQLVRDLENIPIWYRVSWMHFKGTDECKRREVTE